MKIRSKLLVASIVVFGGLIVVSIVIQVGVNFGLWGEQSYSVGLQPSGELPHTKMRVKQNEKEIFTSDLIERVDGGHKMPSLKAWQSLTIEFESPDGWVSWPAELQANRKIQVTSGPMVFLWVDNRIAGKKTMRCGNLKFEFGYPPRSYYIIPAPKSMKPVKLFLDEQEVGTIEYRPGEDLAGYLVDASGTNSYRLEKFFYTPGGSSGNSQSWSYKNQYLHRLPVSRVNHFLHTAPYRKFISSNEKSSAVYELKDVPKKNR